jgi:mannose-1-phosphate guanylyltransferase
MEENQYKSHMYALIMAGGGGTRLWPISREKTPKQFLPLVNSQSLFQITAHRLSKLLPWDRIYVSTATEEYAKEIVKQCPSILKENIIVEPVRRDSGPAHTLGALYIFKKDPQAVIINAASDHLVNPEKNYRATMDTAAKVAYSGDYLVAVGIKPEYPHTGMGHMKRGLKMETANGRAVYKLDKFVEKPELSLAKRFTKSGKYYWNANMYVWRADTFLKAVKEHASDIYTVLNRIAKDIGTSQIKSTLIAEYPKMPKISVDYAVSEKARNVVMIVADYGWTDIGDWNELWKNSPKDEVGNVIFETLQSGGQLINIDTSDALIHTNGRMVAVIDVDNIVVVDTKDALLICSKSKAQKVKQIVEALKAGGKTDLL